MAARGSIAKIDVVNKIAKAFGNDFIGEFDKKYYVWAYENGERVQIALSLTCPKVAVEAGAAVVAPTAPAASTSKNWDFEDESASAPESKPALEITPEEISNIEALMARLGL